MWRHRTAAAAAAPAVALAAGLVFGPSSSAAGCPCLGPHLGWMGSSLARVTPAGSACPVAEAEEVSLGERWVECCHDLKK